jgi:hypothetical protein
MSAAHPSRERRLTAAATAPDQELPKLHRHAAFLRGDTTKRPFDLEVYRFPDKQEHYQALVTAFLAQANYSPLPFQVAPHGPSIGAFSGPHPLLSEDIIFDLEPRTVEELADVGPDSNATTVVWFGSPDPMAIASRAKEVVQPRHNITWKISSNAGLDALSKILELPPADEAVTLATPPQARNPMYPHDRTIDGASRARMLIQLTGPDAETLHQALSAHPVLSRYTQNVLNASSLPDTHPQTSEVHMPSSTGLGSSASVEPKRRPG